MVQSWIVVKAAPIHPTWEEERRETKLKKDQVIKLQNHLFAKREEAKGYVQRILIRRDPNNFQY